MRKDVACSIPIVLFATSLAAAAAASDLTGSAQGKIAPPYDPPHVLPWPPDPNAARGDTDIVVDGQTVDSLIGHLGPDYPRSPATPFTGEWTSTTRRNHALIQIMENGQCKIFNSPVSTGTVPPYPESLPLSWQSAGPTSFAVSYAGFPNAEFPVLSGTVSNYTGASFTITAPDKESSVAYRSARYPCLARVEQMDRIWMVDINQGKYFPNLRQAILTWNRYLRNVADLKAVQREAASLVGEQGTTEGEDIAGDQLKKMVAEHVAKKLGLGVLEDSEACEAIVVAGAVTLQLEIVGPGMLCLYIASLKATGDLSDDVAGEIQQGKNANRYADLKKLLEDPANQQSVHAAVTYLTSYFKLLVRLSTIYSADLVALDSPACRAFDPEARNGYPYLNDSATDRSYFGPVPVYSYVNGAVPFDVEEIRRLNGWGGQ